MERLSNSDKDQDILPDHTPLQSPKRGAIPSPQADIEKAPRYLIETGPAKEDEA